MAYTPYSGVRDDMGLRVIENIYSPGLNEMDVDRSTYKSLFPGTDFKSPVQWNLEDDLKEQLLSAAAASPDAPNEDDTRLVLASLLQSNLGIPYDNARRMADTGFIQQELGLQYRDNGAFEAMSNTFLNTYYNGKAGKAFSKYMATGNEDYVKLADGYSSKALKYRTADSGYGWLGDLAVAGANTAGSSAQMSLAGIVVTGAGTLLGSLIGGPAGAAIGNKVGKGLGMAWTMYESGMQQAGSDFYELYRMTDSQGKHLDLQNPNTKALFFIDAALMGGIEVLGMDWTPGYRQVMRAIAPDAMRTAIAKTFTDRLKTMGVDFIEGIMGEAMEEFAQGIVSDALTNAILESSNDKDGTDFEVKGWRDIVGDASAAFAQAAYGMVLQSALGSALGVASGGAKLADASKNQEVKYEKGMKQGVIDSRYIVQRYDDASKDAKASDASERKGSSSTEKEGEDGSGQKVKIPTIDVVDTEYGAVPATDEDSRNLAELNRRNNGKPFNVAIRLVDVEALPSESRQSVLNSAGLYLQQDGGSVEYTADGRLVFENGDALEQGRKDLEEIGFRPTSDGIYMVAPLDDNGRAYRIGLATRERIEEEGVATKKVSDWKFLNIQRQAGYMESAQDFLKGSEVEYAFRRLVQKTTGIEQSKVDEWFDSDQDSISMELPKGVTWENLAGAANFMPILSRITERDVDDLLSDNDGSIRIVMDEGSSTARNVRTGEEQTVAGGYRTETVEGKTYHTIHLTKDATADTIVHELMHVARALAPKERLSGFNEAYGMQDLWTDDIKDNGDGTYSFNGKVYADRSEAFDEAARNEERFVEDFFGYLATGKAPNREVSTFFEKLKRFIRDVVQRFKDALSPETVAAFDRLLGGDVDATLTDNVDTAVSASGETLYDDERKPLYEANMDVLEDDEDNGLDEYGNRLWSLRDGNTQRRIDADYERTEAELRADSSNFDDEGNHLAPNGAKSNLTYRQWVQVRTPAFINWFGDWLDDPEGSSKIVDGNGEPRVVYRGDSNWVERYNESGLFVSYDRAFAEGYGDVEDLYVNARNPFDGRYDAETLRTFVEENFDSMADEYSEFFDEDEGYDSVDSLMDALKENWWIAYEESEILSEEIARRGYDAVFIQEEDGIDNIWLTSPNQLKSATDNIGSFMVGNDGILYSLSKNDARLREVFGDDGLYDYNGILYIKDDPSFDYSKENIARIKDEVNEELHSFNGKFDGPQGLFWLDEDVGGQGLLDFEGAEGDSKGDPAGVDSGRYSGLREGLSRYFSFERGWNGLEPAIPSVDSQWNNLGYIDFTKVRIRSMEDLAKLYSIYRNPNLEYFHIVLTKGDEIVDSLAISSGISSMTRGIVGRTAEEGYETIKARMENSGADGYYLLHNHPSGRIEASVADMALTSGYKKNLDGFKGHIILDHNKYTLISDDMSMEAMETDGFHETEGMKVMFTASDGKSLAAGYSRFARSGTDIMFARFTSEGFGIVSILPSSGIDFMSLGEMAQLAKNSYASRAFLLTDSKADFDGIVERLKTKPYHVFQDVVLVEGFKMRSAFEEDPQFKERCLPLDNVLMMMKREEGGFYQPSFQTGDETLFSLSPKVQEEYLKRREKSIEEALRNGSFVRTEFLRPFRGQEWADDELSFRDFLHDNPDLLDEAKKYDSFDRYLEDMKAQAEIDSWGEDMDEGISEAETKRADEWYERIYGYAHMRTSADLDRQFAAEWTSSEDKTLQLAKTIANYREVFFRSSTRMRDGGRWYARNVYGAYKGVSTKVLRLSDGHGRRGAARPRSSSAEIQEAQRLIRENPLPYRLALAKAEAQDSIADRVIRGRLPQGAFDELHYAQADNMDSQLEYELQNLEEENAAKKRRNPIADYRRRANELERKLKDAQADLSRYKVDSRATVESLRRQLGEAKDAEKDLQRQMKDAERQVDAIIERMGSRIEREQDRTAFMEGQAKQARSRANDISKRLTESKNEIKRLNLAIAAMQRRNEAREASRYRKERISQIKESARFNPDSLDASFEDSFAWIRSLFVMPEDRKGLARRISELGDAIEQMELGGEDASSLRQELLDLKAERDRSDTVQPPSQLALYLPDEYLVRADNRQSKWSAQELDTLLTAVKLMRNDARQMLADRKDVRTTALNAKTYGFFRQTYNRDAALDSKGEMSPFALKDDLLSNETEKSYKLGNVGRRIDAVNLTYAKIQRLARIIDGDKEGIFYDFFVRRCWHAQSNELAKVSDRMDASSAEWRKLGLGDLELARTGFRGEKVNGSKYKLSRGQMVGVYVYSKSQLGYEKLTSPLGNGIKESDVKAIVETLTDKERAWGDFLLKDMDSNYRRLADTYYEVWNRNLGRRDAYFPLVSTDRLVAGETDFLCEEPQTTKKGKAYVDKGFTKDVNPNAMYALNLEVTATWTSQVRRQEHFIAYGAWSRDAQYLLGKGGMGDIIKQRHGTNMARTVQDIVNHIVSTTGRAGGVLDETFSGFLSARGAAVIVGNLSSTFKQFASAPAALTGDTGLREWLKANPIVWETSLQNFLLANRELNGSGYKDIHEFIYANAPDLRNRKVDSEILRYLNRSFGNPVSVAIQKANDKIAQYTMDLVDRMVVERLWFACYLTQFERNRQAGMDVQQSHDEARFKASQLISETQNSNMRMDFSTLQIDAQNNTWLRMLSLFTNQAMNLANQVRYDVPLAIRNRDWRRIAGVSASVLLSVFMESVVTGRILPRKDEDGDEYKERLLREIIAKCMGTYDPIFLANAAESIDGYFGGGDFVTLGSSLGEALHTLTDKDKEPFDKFMDVLKKTGEEMSNGFGVPITLFKRPIKAIREGNPGYLMNNEWGEIWESYR